MKNVILVLATILLTFSAQAQCDHEASTQSNQIKTQSSAQPVTIWKQKLR